jgi:hypothetical protein
MLQDIPIIGSFLGSDTGAKAAQDAAEKRDAEASRREGERNDLFRQQQAGIQAADTAKSKAETDKAMADLKTAQDLAKKQAAALAVTGGNLGPAGAVSAGLPGFDQLKKRAGGNNPAIAQSNLITAAPTLTESAGINPAAGGRRYI